LKDQAAACVIMNRFIDFYNEEEQEGLFSSRDKENMIKENSEKEGKYNYF